MDELEPATGPGSTGNGSGSGKVEAEPAVAGDDGGGAVEARAGEERDPDVDRRTLLWAMAGDDSAFARLVQHYDPSLRALVFAQVERADLMDRVLASTYLKAYRALPRLKAVGEPGAWLSGIAAKACASEMRRESQRVQSRRQSAEPPAGAAAVGVSHRVDPVSAHPDAAGPQLRPKPAAGQPEPARRERDQDRTEALDGEEEGTDPGADDPEERVTLLVPEGDDPDDEANRTETGGGEDERAGPQPPDRDDSAGPAEAGSGEDDTQAVSDAGDQPLPAPTTDRLLVAETGEAPTGDAPEGADPEVSDHLESLPAGTGEAPTGEAPGSGPEAGDEPALTPTGFGDPAPAETADADRPIETHAHPGSAAEAVVEEVGSAPGSDARSGAADAAAVTAGAGPGRSGSEVPDHLPGFWDRLGRQLLAEREVPARPAPTPEQIRAARAASAQAASPVGNGPAPPRWGRPSDPLTRLEPPATVGELAQRVKPPERRTFAIVRQAVSVVLVIAAVATIAFLAFRIGGSARPLNRDGMTAGKLATQVTSTLDDSTTVTAGFSHGEYTPEGGKLEATYDLTFGSNGSFRLHGTNQQTDISYNAAEGVRRERSEIGGPDGTPQLRQVEARGLATGPPDPSATVNRFFEGDLADVLREMRDQPDRTVESSRFGGRPTWQVSIDLPGGAGAPDEALLQVDKQLLVPTQLVLSSDGDKVRDFSLTNVALDQAVQEGTFTVVFSDGPVQQTDDGFVRRTLDDVSVVLDGYQPATPSFLPEGFELTEVAVHDGRGGRTGPDGANPPSFNVVSLTYRRGWEALTVTTRSNTAEIGQQWFDPFATTNPVPEADTVTLQGGRFRLVEAQRVVGPDVVPHLWGVTGEVVFTVAGDLSGDDLVGVAESIR